MWSKYTEMLETRVQISAAPLKFISQHFSSKDNIHLSRSNIKIKKDFIEPVKGFYKKRSAFH